MEGYWQNGLVLFCGRNERPPGLEEEQDVDQGTRTNGLTSVLQAQHSLSTQPAHSDVKSSQPTHHPPMVFLIVEKGCEVERIRGGCFPCRTGKVAASFSGSDGAPGIPIDTTAPTRVMQLAPETGQLNPEQPLVSSDPARSRLPSRTAEPGQSNLLSPASISVPPAVVDSTGLRTPSRARPSQTEAGSSPTRGRLGSQILAPTQPPVILRPRLASHI